ncbi:hypothetical protein CEXT_224991 [Caerostris extrusa]|uniref:Post-SET domain-containing protein n=1 Tax=Caerostris extrusa TaxID=172846 RepID=A0AAV4XV58_CAEEX|nr:hypothetical protein CEXT_224991 [Caerostris extrusa]
MNAVHNNRLISLNEYIFIRNCNLPTEIHLLTVNSISFPLNKIHSFYACLDMPEGLSIVNKDSFHLCKCGVLGCRTKISSSCIIHAMQNERRRCMKKGPLKLRTQCETSLPSALKLIWFIVTPLLEL